MNLANTSAVRWAELRMIPPSERKDSLIMLASNAFFDESGTHDGSEIIAIAGLISNYDAWARFEIEWQGILASKGIKEGFHFSEFIARKGEFDNDWSDDERNAFMQRLCTSVSDNIVIGLATSTFRSEYEAVIPQALKNYLRDPYYFGLYSCLYQLISWPHFKTKIQLPRELEFLFDRKKKFEGLATDIYYTIRDDLLARVNPDSSHASIFGDMGFGNRKKDIPLQAADLFVGVVARNFAKARRQNASLEAIMEKSLRVLGGSGRLLVSNAGPDELELFVKTFKSVPK